MLLDEEETRDYAKRMTFRLTTDFSSTAMDASKLESNVFQVLSEVTFHQEPNTPLN